MAALSWRLLQLHTSGIAFRHLPPDSAKIVHATKGVLFISTKLSTAAVSAPRTVRSLNTTVEAT